MDFERSLVLAGEKKWEDFDIRGKSVLLKAMGYPMKVPAWADIGTLQNFSDCGIGFLWHYLLHQEPI